MSATSERSSNLALRVAALACAAGFMLTGCGAQSYSTNAGSDSRAQAPQATAAGDQQEDTASGERQKSDKVPADTPDVNQQMLAKRAAVTVKVADVSKAAADIRSIAAVNGGLVTNESINLDSSTSYQYSTITISVPADKLDAALQALAKTGSVTSQQVQVEDVTTQVVDVESRIKTMRASLERTRALLAKATKISEIMAIESELTQRQADLEALLAVQKTLKNQVDRSPITVTLVAPGQKAPDPEPTTGFLVGLKGGWKALTTTGSVLLTVLGALLPFLGVGTIIAAPIVWLVRRRRAARKAASPTQPAPAAGPAPQPQGAGQAGPRPQPMPRPQPPAPAGPRPEQRPQPAQQPTPPRDSSDGKE